MKAAVLQEHIEALKETVLSKEKIRAVGGNSKTALSGWGNLELQHLNAVLEYNPLEYTFTALAGTPVREMNSLLAEHGQYLPFDPPLADAGATLGGTVAAGLSGPGRFRYGGVRDFLLGVTFISGDGQVLTGGGKVVKNAAGFDFPKLMVGSLGQFGILTSMTFKVFPRPEAYISLQVNLSSFADALSSMQALAASNLDLHCLELVSPATLLIRLAGSQEALAARLERLKRSLASEGRVLQGAQDEQLWHEAREFSWLPQKHKLLKIPTSASRLQPLEDALEAFGTLPRRYAVGGNVLYLAWPESLSQEQLDAFLKTQQLSALALQGRFGQPLLGTVKGKVFMTHIRNVLDPEGKFVLGSGGQHAT